MPNTNKRRREPRATVAEPIAVDRNEAKRLLGNIGDDKLYQLVNGGEIESYLDGNKRKYLYASLKAYTARMVAKQNGLTEPPWIRSRREAARTSGGSNV